jgi:hypothetical protein
MLRSIVLTLLLGVAGLAAPAATAATVGVNAAGGLWANPVYSRGTAGVTGFGSSTIRWGRPAPWSVQSKYTFIGGPAVTSSAPGAFLIGAYSHTNGTIYSTSARIAGADLDLTVAGSINGQAFSFANSFRFTHNETLNSANPCVAGGGRNCGDYVTIAALNTAPFTATQGASVFTLLIDGFVTALNGPVVTSFLNPEGATRTLYLQARWQEVITNANPDPDPVPLPAAGFLMIAALGTLTAARTRSRH